MVLYTTRLIKLLHHTYHQFCRRSFDEHCPSSSATGVAVLMLGLDGVITNRTKHHVCPSNTPCIKQQESSLNRDQGLDLNPVWDPIIKTNFHSLDHWPCGVFFHR